MTGSLWTVSATSLRRRDTACESPVCRTIPTEVKRHELSSATCLRLRGALLVSHGQRRMVALSHLRTRAPPSCTGTVLSLGLVFLAAGDRGAVRNGAGDGGGDRVGSVLASPRAIIICSPVLMPRESNLVDSSSLTSAVGGKPNRTEQAKDSSARALSLQRTHVTLCTDDPVGMPEWPQLQLFSA